MDAATAATTTAPGGACDLCPEARRRAAESGCAVECGDCERRHDPPPASGVLTLDAGAVERALAEGRATAANDAPRLAPPTWAAWRALTATAEPRNPPTERGARRPATVWYAPESPPAEPEGTPLERAGAAAKALAPHDPDLVRIRILLADLRPDCADPWEPPPAEVQEVAGPPVVIHDPSESHGGIPRGVGRYEPEPTGAGGVPLADVLDEIARLPADAAAVLLWLRDRASLREGLRGLFVDLGLAFATDEQEVAWGLRDGTATKGAVGARREGAPVHGRKLALKAAGAWRR